MRRVLWILGALAGVVLAAGVTYAASSLSTPRVGLSAEPPSAGARPRAPRHGRRRTPKPTPEAHADPEAASASRSAPPRRGPATTVPVPTAAPTVDDHGGEGGGDDSSGQGGGERRAGRGHPEDD